MRKSIAALALWVITGALSTSASAAFTETVGPLALQSNSIVGFAFEVSFASSTGPETLTLTIDASTDGGAVGMFNDVDRSATATNATEWNNACFLVGSLGYGQGSQAINYTTPNYAGGFHRFAIYLEPANTGGTFPCNVTITLSNTGNAASLGPVVQPQVNILQGTGLGASTSSNGTATIATSTVFPWYSSMLAGTTDEVQFEFSVDFGGTATTTPRDIGMYANAFTHASYPPAGTGNLVFDLYDITEDGFSAPPSLTMTVASAGSGPFGGGEDAKTYSVPAGRQGVHTFRVIMRGDAGMTPNILAFFGMSFDGRLTLQPLTFTPATATPRIDISPVGGSLTTSPTALTASGGTPTATYNWSFTGTVPAGVGYNTAGTTTATGASVNLIFGATTPTGATVTVRVTNGTGPEFDEETYTLNFSGGGGGNSLTIITTSLPNGSETVTYTTTNITATSTGTTGPTYTWSVSAGTIPPGLVLDTAATGLSTTISGTPTTAGTYNFTVQITDGTNSDTQDFQVDISAAGSLVITTASLPAGTQGVAYSANITAINGTGNHTWSITSGTLPTGLALGASTTGTVSISGTPTQTGTFPITVQVTDSTSPTAQTDTQAFSLVINAGSPPPTLGGGGGGGGGGGCAAAEGSSYWMLALGLLAVLGLGLRMRARRE